MQAAEAGTLWCTHAECTSSLEVFSTPPELAAHVRDAHATAAADDADDADDVAARSALDVTTILVTSPILSHPSPELLLKVIESLGLARGLDRCPLFIIADHAKATDNGKYKLKQGRVTPAMNEAYRQYLDTLDRLVAEAAPGTVWSRARVVRMGKRVGFSHAVLAGLRMATTEYAMVLQHDNAFTRPFDVSEVLGFMAEHGAPYVKMPFSKIFRALNRWDSDASYQLDMRARSIMYVAGPLTARAHAACARLFPPPPPTLRRACAHRPGWAGTV